MSLFIEYFQQYWGHFLILVVNCILSLHILFEVLRSYINNDWDYKIPGFAFSSCICAMIFFMVMILFFDKTQEISKTKYIEIAKNEKCIELLSNPIRKFHLERKDYQDCISNSNDKKVNDIKKNMSN